MLAHDIGFRTGEELVRFVRALGRHRYVASRLHLVHAFAVEAAWVGSADPELEGARAWSDAILSDDGVDRGSKDERLFCRATDAELVAVLGAFLSPRDGAAAAHDRLAVRLSEIGAQPDARDPFDETCEDDVFPVLVDAGWELLPLGMLDPERHRGAIEAFGDPLAFEVARFEEDGASPAEPTLHELPVFGAVELLRGLDDDGRTRAPFVLWASGHEAYLDYVLRGVMRAAKLT